MKPTAFDRWLLRMRKLGLTRLEMAIMLGPPHVTWSVIAAKLRKLSRRP